MRFRMVRSVIQAVSAANSSMTTTISGSTVVGVCSRVCPRSRSARRRISATASSRSSAKAVS